MSLFDLADRVVVITGASKNIGTAISLAFAQAGADVVMVARADGTLAADVRPLVRLSVSVIAEQGKRRESGSGGGGGRFGLAYFDDAMITPKFSQRREPFLVTPKTATAINKMTPNV